MLLTKLKRKQLHTLVLGRGFRHVDTRSLTSLRHLEVWSYELRGLRTGNLESLVLAAGEDHQEQFERAVDRLEGLAPMRSLYLHLGVAYPMVDPPERFLKAIAGLGVETWGMNEAPGLGDPEEPWKDAFFPSLARVPRWPSLKRVWLPRGEVPEEHLSAWREWLGPVPWFVDAADPSPSGRWVHASRRSLADPSAASPP